MAARGKVQHVPAIIGLVTMVAVLFISLATIISFAIYGEAPARQYYIQEYGSLPEDGEAFYSNLTNQIATLQQQALAYKRLSSPSAFELVYTFATYFMYTAAFFMSIILFHCWLITRVSIDFLPPCFFRSAYYQGWRAVFISQ